MIVISVLFVIPNVLAATYTVGDNLAWATPTGGDPYATWASQHTFVVGDILGITLSYLWKNMHLLKLLLN